MYPYEWVRQYLKCRNCYQTIESKQVKLYGKFHLDEVNLEI